MYQRIRSQTDHRQTHHQANLIRLMTANTENQKEDNAIKIKSIGSTQNRTRQTHCRATLIRPTKFIIKARDTVKIRAAGKINGTLSNYTQN